jgi:hypothetical protein
MKALHLNGLKAPTLQQPSCRCKAFNLALTLDNTRINLSQRMMNQSGFKSRIPPPAMMRIVIIDKTQNSPPEQSAIFLLLVYMTIRISGNVPRCRPARRLFPAPIDGEQLDSLSLAERCRPCSFKFISDFWRAPGRTRSHSSMVGRKKARLPQSFALEFHQSGPVGKQ